MATSDTTDYQATSTEGRLEIPPQPNSESDLAPQPTTKHELWGWYAYAWAAEPFIVSAVGTYVPILLEQFAREKGVRLDDYNTPCLASLPGTSFPGTSFPDLPGNKTGDLLPPGDIGDPGRGHQCVVEIFGSFYIDTSSFALYTFSFSVLIQTLVVISMSGAADRGKFRKKLIVWFGCVGALATCGFLLVNSSHYLIPALLAIVSNSCFGAVSVCGNSYLPVLVNNHPETLAAIKQAETKPYHSNREHRSLESAPLLEARNSNPLSHPEVIAATSKISSKISGTGVAIGYFAALIVQISSMLIIVWAGSTTSSLRLAIFFVGVWWLIFQIPVSLLLRSRPGPPLPAPIKPSSSKYKKHSKWSSVKRKVHRILMFSTNGGYAYIKYGWKTIFATFKEARQMKDVALFLLAWFMVSDAAMTINSAAILFARTEFQMSAPSLAGIGILVVISGIAGATLIPRYVVPRIAAKNPVAGIVFVVCIAAMIPAYGVLGFYTKYLGLRSSWEMYVLAVWYGFALGGLNTLCRSIFSMLIPRGKESTFFSLFSVTDKGSSIIGPLVAGVIVDRTHDIRYTFYFLLGLMVLPLAVFYHLDVERGSQEATYLEAVEAEDEDDDDEDGQ